jgi:putative transposase
VKENDSYHRRSIRLPGYDYSEPGDYFITMVTHEREHLFGEIGGGEMRLSPEGEIVRDCWLVTPTIRPNVELGAFVVMPNHFHAIVTIADQPVGAYCHTPLQNENRKFRSPSQTLGAIVRGLKGATTKRINDSRGTPEFSVWQRNYYEHIIQSDEEYETIAAYIASNPDNWASDKEFS